MNFEVFINRVRYFALDDNQVQVRSRVGFATSIGSEEDNLERRVRGSDDFIRSLLYGLVRQHTLAFYRVNRGPHFLSRPTPIFTASMMPKHVLKRLRVQHPLRPAFDLLQRGVVQA